MREGFCCGDTLVPTSLATATVEFGAEDGIVFCIFSLVLTLVCLLFVAPIFLSLFNVVALTLRAQGLTEEGAEVVRGFACPLTLLPAWDVFVVFLWAEGTTLPAVDIAVAVEVLLAIGILLLLVVVVVVFPLLLVVLGAAFNPLCPFP